MNQDKAPEWATAKAKTLVPDYVKRSIVENIALALSQAYERGKSESEARMAELLKDPVAVRVNYLRGGIACQPLIDEAYERGQVDMRERAANETHTQGKRLGETAVGFFIAKAIRSLPIDGKDAT